MKNKTRSYFVVVSKVTDLHVLLQIVVVKVFLHPGDVAPVEVPITLTKTWGQSSQINSLVK